MMITETTLCLHDRQLITCPDPACVAVMRGDYFHHPDLSLWERERRRVCYELQRIAREIGELGESPMFRNRVNRLRGLAEIVSGEGDHLSLLREV